MRFVAPLPFACVPPSLPVVVLPSPATSRRRPGSGVIQRGKKVGMRYLTACEKEYTCHGIATEVQKRTLITEAMQGI